jgi:hypothetical protein
LKKAAAVACDAAAFAVPAIVYILSASSEPGAWDTAELQGVPYILGIAHPTGFPLYVLLGYVWSHLVAVGTIAFRMNVMSGIAMAVVVATAYALARAFEVWRPVALFAALWFGFTQDVWAHASRAEAQDLAVAFEALAVYAFVRWMKGGSDRWFVAAFALDGLGMAAHPNAIWVIFGFIAGCLAAKRRPRARLVLGSLGLVAAALALYLYLPLRSAYVVAHGLDPAHVLAGAGGGIFWNYNDPSTLHGLLRELSGSESGTPGAFLSAFDPLHLQAALWALIDGFAQQYGAIALVLAAAGLVSAWRRDRRTTLFVCVACSAALLYTAADPREADIGRYQMLAWFLGVPLLGSLAPVQRDGPAPSLGRIAMTLFLAAGAGVAFSQQLGNFAHAPGEGGRWVINAVRPYVPRGGVIVVSWLDATSLAYGAYVDGSLPGRIVVSDDRWRVPLYRDWARSRRVFILTDPHGISALPQGTSFYKSLDGYHELLEVRPDD